MSRRVSVSVSRYATHVPFVIARGSKSEAVQVDVSITDGPYTGWGTCVPYRRYGETVDSVIDMITALGPDIANGLEPEALNIRMPPGAARNAIDCALWDLRARQTGQPVWSHAGIPEPVPSVTAVTISAGTPAAMAAVAADRSAFPLLKIKLAGDDQDVDRIQAIHAVRRDASLILDGNEALDRDTLERLTDSLETATLRLIEQPVPADNDRSLAGCSHGVTFYVPMKACTRTRILSTCAISMAGSTSSLTRPADLPPHCP